MTDEQRRLIEAGIAPADVAEAVAALAQTFGDAERERLASMRVPAWVQRATRGTLPVRVVYAAD